MQMVRGLPIVAAIVLAGQAAAAEVVPVDHHQHLFSPGIVASSA